MLVILIMDAQDLIPTPEATKTKKQYRRVKRIERTCEGCGARFLGDASIAHWQRFCPTKCQPQRKREFTRERQRRYRATHKEAR